jgi:hypothetical protein
VRSGQRARRGPGRPAPSRDAGRTSGRVHPATAPGTTGSPAGRRGRACPPSQSRPVAGPTRQRRPAAQRAARLQRDSSGETAAVRPVR